MRIRHVIALADIDPVSGLVTMPERARHAIIVAGRLQALSGSIDPLTHLNLDEPDHRLTECVVATTLSVGAPVIYAGDHLRWAPVPRHHFSRRGTVDHGARRADWLAAVAARRGVSGE